MRHDSARWEETLSDSPDGTLKHWRGIVDLVYVRNFHVNIVADAQYINSNVFKIRWSPLRKAIDKKFECGLREFDPVFIEEWGKKWEKAKKSDRRRNKLLSPFPHFVEEYLRSKWPSQGQKLEILSHSAYRDRIPSSLPPLEQCPILDSLTPDLPPAYRPAPSNTAPTHSNHTYPSEPSRADGGEDENEEGGADRRENGRGGGSGSGGSGSGSGGGEASSDKGHPATFRSFLPQPSAKSPFVTIARS